MASLNISKSDYDFINEYVDTPFKGYEVTSTNFGYALNYSDDKAFDHFSTNYNFGLVEFGMDSPDYEINDIGRRLEGIYDKLFDQI